MIFPRRYLKSLRSLRLTDEERHAIQSRLATHLLEHPLRTEAQTGGFHIPLRHFFMTSRFAVVGTLAVLVLLAGTGISFAAEGSLPGEPLYPVKVNVNEQMRATLSFTADAKAEWEVERAERRLEETEELISRGKLDADTTAVIAASFEKHSDEIIKSINSLTKNDNVEAAAAVNSNFDATLRAHHRILGLLAAEPETGEAVQPLIATVESSSNSGIDVGSDLEAKISTKADEQAKASAEGRKRSAEKKLKEVSSSYKKTKSGSSANVQTQIETKLSNAAKLYGTAEVKLKAGNYSQAFTEFQQADRAAEEARVLVKSRKHLELGIMQKEAKDTAQASSTTTIELRTGDDSGQKRNEDRKKDDNNRNEEDRSDDNDTSNSTFRTNSNLNTNGSIGL